MVGPELLGTYPLGMDQMNKFQNGFVARDGCVYAIPQRSRAVLRIVPAADGTSDPIIQLLDCGDNMAQYKDKFEGGVMGADGCIYCIPLIAKKVIKIIPAAPPGKQQLLGPPVHLLAVPLPEPPALLLAALLPEPPAHLLEAARGRSCCCCC